jgi:4-hydroxybenzoate polyprenyltransferase
LLPTDFAIALVCYYGFTLAYSLRLKRIPILDVIVLAGLFTLRVIAGGRSTGVEVSFWLLALSMFVFLSLALSKRYAEILDKKIAGDHLLKDRGYQLEDLQLLGSLGAAAGYCAVLVLALYFNSEQALSLYPNKGMLWIACPLLLFWISRLWLITGRGRMHDDPLIFAMRDRLSLLCAAAVAALLALASM